MTFSKVLWVTLLATIFCASPPVARADQTQTPDNQVFQFMFTATRSDWADGSKTTATAYLWIPEKCAHLRGLLVMGTNVPEQMLAGNSKIRAAAAANDLGIVWSTPTFWYSKSKNEDKTTVAFLEQLLDGLAKVSGYAEVATIPWLPIGESGHLLMVDALVEAAPERCIAGIWLKNPHMPPHNRSVPALIVFGTQQEWGQDKADYAARWQDTHFYDKVIAERQQNPGWPLTFMIDGYSGHFDVSAALVLYLAHYIDAVSKARLPAAGGLELRSIDLSRGFLADLPVPGHSRNDPRSYASVPAGERGLPWYFDRQGAADAQAVAAIDWHAQSPLIGFTDCTGNRLPFDFNGITGIKPKMDADGITFHLCPVLLDKQPDNFLHPGEALAQSASTPTLEWMCGAVTPVGGDALRVSLDRGYHQQAIYYTARVAATGLGRGAVQPIGIMLQPNRIGLKQTISFAKTGDVKVGTTSIPLQVTSDRGLPVEFFVVAGPAQVVNHRLVFTMIPPHTSFPVAVTIAAWQWGRETEPKIQQADPVKQTILIQR